MASYRRKRGDKIIPTGRQGFLITCDVGRERQCARECIYLLDQYFEKLTSSGEQVASTDKGKNIDELLEAEIVELRDKDKVRFADIETGCKGVVFIEMIRDAPVGPAELAESIVRTVADTKKSKARFCMKLLPAEVTCYASASEVAEAAQPLISKHFPAVESETQGLKFAVVYEARANTGLHRMKLIEAIAELVPTPHSVDLKAPDKTIIVQVVKTTCTIGVVSDYKELAKYNLRQLVMPAEEEQAIEPENEEEL